MQSILTAAAAVLIAVSVAACGQIAPAHLSHPVAATLKPSPVRTLKPLPGATRQKPTGAPKPSETAAAVVPASPPAAVSVTPAPATTAPQRADVARLEQDGFPAQQVLPYAAGSRIAGAAYGCNTAGVGQMVMLADSDATARQEAILMGSGPTYGEVVSYTGDLIITTDTCTGLSLIVAQAGWPVP